MNNLSRAIRSNNIELVNLILSTEGARLPNLITYVVLFEAIQSNNIELVNRILSIEGLDLPNLIHNGVLIRAIQTNNIEIVNRILSIEGLNLRISNDELHEAIRSNNIEILNRILSIAPLNSPNFINSISLQYIITAIRTNNIEILNRILLIPGLNLRYIISSLTYTLLNSIGRQLFDNNDLMFSYSQDPNRYRWIWLYLTRLYRENPELFASIKNKLDNYVLEFKRLRDFKIPDANLNVKPYFRLKYLKYKSKYLKLKNTI